MKHYSILVFMLLLGMVTLVQAQSVDLFENGFETWPPPGWLLNGVAWVSATTTTIPDVEPTNPYEGNYCAGMSSNPDNYLISPLKNNPGSYYFFVHKKDTGNYQFIVEFQVEDGLSPGADISGSWTFIGEYWAHLGWWEPLTINLTGFAPGYVRIRPSPPPPTPLKYMYFDRYCENTVPVELSSFTAVLVQQPNQQYLVKLQWITQTETQVAGYRVFRNYTNDASTAMQINLGLIEASNTSEQSHYEFTDSETELGTWYYWLQSNDFNGSMQLFGPISINVNSGSSEVPQVNFSTQIKDIYPNPFVHQATIPYLLGAKSNVKLDIYNQKGQLIWSHSRANSEAGLYQTFWNGKDMQGREVSAGVYFCRMTTDNYLGTKKLIFLK